MREEHALVVAMELLRKQLADLPMQLAANTQRTPADFERQGRAAQQATGGGRDATEYEKKLRAFNNDPGRRDAKARAALEAAQNKAWEAANPGKAAALGAAKSAGKNLVGASGMAGGAVSGVVGKMGPVGLAAGPILSVMEQVAGKFASIVGPMALLESVLNSGIAGFQVLQQSVKVWASTVAPVLLPVTLMLSAGFLAVADVLTEKLGPLFDKFFDQMLTYGVPVLEGFVTKLEFLVDLYVAYTEVVEEVLSVLRGFTDLDPTALLGLVSPVGGLLFGGPSSEGARKSVDNGLRDTLQSLKQSLGPKASFTGLGGVAQQAQMAALNQDPLEARLLKQQLQVLTQIDGKLGARSEANRNPRVHDPAILGGAGLAVKVGVKAFNTLNSLLG